MALVPAKVLAGAKSRLAGVADETQRAEVALDMLHAVLEQLHAISGLDAVAVVTADERVGAVARRLGAERVTEAGGGLNVALEAGRAWAIERGAEALLVVLSDLPLVRAADVEAVLAAQAAVAIAPSKDGGTNALLLRPAAAIPFRFGRDSARYHQFEAENRGLAVELIYRESLAFDVDTPDDLARYQTARRQVLARP